MTTSKSLLKLEMMSQDGSIHSQCNLPDCCRNVYVASLPLYFDDQLLFELFAPYGRISSARVMRAKGSHQSKGYGFVMFRDSKNAECAIESLNGRTLAGSRIQVRLANADACNAFEKAPTHNHHTVPMVPAAVQMGAAPSSFTAPAIPVIYSDGSVAGYAPTQSQSTPILLPTVPSQSYPFSFLINQPIVQPQVISPIMTSVQTMPVYYMLDGQVAQGSSQ